MKKYFIHNGTEELGPFDVEQLKSMNLKSDIPIWFDGLEEWTIIGKVEELKGVYTSMPPPLNLNKDKSEEKPIQTKAKPEKKKSANGVYVKIFTIIGIIAVIAFVLSKSNQQNGSGLKIEYNPASPVVISSSADRSKSGLLKLRATVYATVKNQGGAGNVIVTFSITQNGEEFTQSKEIFMIEGEVVELDATFDQVTRLNGDMVYNVRARAD